MTVDRLAVLSRKKMRPTVALALLLFVYALLTGAYLVPRAAIANLDFWYHLSLAQQLDWGAPGTLVDGLYPLGYPFLLRIALGMAIDALRAGQFLS